MSQKPTKNSSQSKRLKKQLEEATRDKLRWEKDYYSKCNALEKSETKIEVYENSERFIKEILAEQNYREISRLQEIIRWLIKPSTTERKRPEDILSPRSPRFRGDRF